MHYYYLFAISFATMASASSCSGDLGKIRIYFRKIKDKDGNFKVHISIEHENPDLQDSHEDLTSKDLQHSFNHQGLLDNFIKKDDMFFHYDTYYYTTENVFSKDKVGHLAYLQFIEKFVKVFGDIASFSLD